MESQPWYLLLVRFGVRKRRVGAPARTVRFLSIHYVDLICLYVCLHKGLSCIHVGVFNPKHLAWCVESPCSLVEQKQCVLMKVGSPEWGGKYSSVEAPRVLYQDLLRWIHPGKIVFHLKTKQTFPQIIREALVIMFRGQRVRQMGKITTLIDT